MILKKKKIGYGLVIAKNYRVGAGIGYPSGTARVTCFCILKPTSKSRLEEAGCWIVSPPNMRSHFQKQVGWGT